MSSPSRSTARQRRIASLDEIERRRLAELLGGQTYLWATVVQRQGDRVKAADRDYVQAEIYQYALALRVLLRCGEVAAELGGDVGAALSAFDAVAPDAKDVRDVLDHFDDYLLGIGRLQRRRPGAEFGFMYGRSGDGTDANLFVIGLDLTLPIDAATDAALQVAAAVVEAFN